VWLDAMNMLSRVSRPFFFNKKGSEFVAGLAWHPDGMRLLISYGVDDAEAWIAVVEASDVWKALSDVTNLPTGAPAANESAQPSVAARLPTGRSFDLFDTLVARRCVDPNEVFVCVERVSGHAGFASLRRAAEAEISSRLYTFDDIYRQLAAHHGVPAVEAERLKVLELETEAVSLFPILEHCQEVGPNDVVVSDMYLPAEWLMKILRDTCGLEPHALYVSSHGKRNGTVWGTIRRQLTLAEHVGDNPVTDLTSAQTAGVPARLTTVARRTAVEEELAAGGFMPLSNLIREARLTTWNDDVTLRQAQLAQIQLNFPLLFLVTLHLSRLARVQGWDNVLMSGRDCYLWNELYKRIRPMLVGAPPASYFYTSRPLRAFPSPSYLAYLSRLRTGQRNVVVDLCGTGWSLSRLIERSPEPPTAIFLFHRIELPDLLRRYEKYGPLARPIEIHSIIAAASKGGDNDVLEELNRAPHAMLDDVKEGPDGFVPIFSSIEYSNELAGLMRVHHAAFHHSCALLKTLTNDGYEAMQQTEVTSALDGIYSRMAGMLSRLMPFAEHKRREEPLVWQALADHQQQSESTADALV